MLLVVGEPVKRWTCAYKACQALCCRQNRELTLKDIEKIAKATGMKKEDFIRVNPKKRSSPFILKKKGGKCVFLKKSFQCQLHSIKAKPILCQTYPFLLSRVIHGDEPILEVKLAKDCPGLGKGPSFGDKSVRTVAENTKNYLDGLREVAKLSQQGVTPNQMLKQK